ncbi:MAG: hypothetical protein CMJ23_13710 [Phycisphaerae bacterium]|nr:hypothetical protein [Phycisphaerae bacterium]
MPRPRLVDHFLRHLPASRIAMTLSCVAIGLSVGCQSVPVKDAGDSEMIAGTTRLVIEVETAQWENEQLYLAVFQAPEDFLEEDRWVESIVTPVVIPVTRVIFEDVRTIPSAISGFIDIERDKTLTRNFIGLPAEPWGFSNDQSVILGLPSFENVAVELQGPTTVVRFRMGTSLDRSKVRRERRGAPEASSNGTTQDS